MSSKKETIMAAVETLIKTVTAGSIQADNIVRTRLSPFDVPDMPAVRIEQGIATPEENKLGKLDWKLIVSVRTYQKGDIPDSEADAICASIHEKMMAANALGLGYIIDIIPKEVDPNYDFAEYPFVEFVQEFEIIYETSKGEI